MELPNAMRLAATTSSPTVRGPGVGSTASFWATASVVIQRFRYEMARPASRLTAWTIPSPPAQSAGRVWASIRLGPICTYCPDKAAGSFPVTRRFVMVVSSATGASFADREACSGPLGMVSSSD